MEAGSLKGEQSVWGLAVDSLGRSLQIPLAGADLFRVKNGSVFKGVMVGLNGGMPGEDDSAAKV